MSGDMGFNQEGMSLVKWGLGVLAAAISTLAGWALKRGMAENKAGDTVYDVSTATIQRQAAEIAERDAKIKALLSDIHELSSQRNKAESIAAKMSAKAEVAEEAAARASQAAQEARDMLAEMQAARQRDRNYIARLRAMLIEAGIDPPEEE